MNLMLVLRSNLKLSCNYYYSVAKSKKDKTFYQLLEVPSSATPTVIKKNYLKLAKIYHPDVYKGADKNRFTKIQQAYKTLSNQSERSKYDETIGLKSSYQSQQERTNEGEQKDGKSNIYGKEKNDFSYKAKPKVEINIDEEYEKFFKKKSTTPFEDIRLHEQNEFKAMSENERVRRRFKEVYTNPNLDWKMGYSKSYNQVLDDQIKQKNSYEEQLKRKKEEYQKKYSEKGLAFRMKLVKIGGGILFIAMLPFIFSFKTKLELEKKAKEGYENKISQIFSEIENTQIRNRMRFD